MKSIQTMTDEELLAFIMETYKAEAEHFNTSVDKMFDIKVLMQWFREGFPDEIHGMSEGMIKLATLPLIEQGIIAEGKRGDTH